MSTIDYSQFTHLRDLLLSRCEEDGDCLLWTGSMNNSGRCPQHQTVVDGRRVWLQVRRVLWACGHPDIIVGRRLVMSLIGETKCRNRCVTPEHLHLCSRSTMVSRSYVNRRTIQESYARSLGHPAAKLDHQKAEQIRMSTDSTAALAERFGVSTSRINAIRRGEGWKTVAANSSVFSFRPTGSTR